MRGRAFRQLGEIQLDDAAAPSAFSLPMTPTYISRPSTYSSISTGELKFACSQSIRSISSRIEVTKALNSMPIEPSSRAGLTITGNVEVVREVQAAAERAREDRRVDAVELENLFRHRLVLRVEQAMRAGPGEALAEQLEIRGDAVVGGVVPGERLGQVEHEIAIELGEAVQALGRSVEHVRARRRVRACRAPRRLRPRLLSCRACASAAPCRSPARPLGLLPAS